MTASVDVLRTAFATEGYHRRVARARPFLSIKAKEKRLDWAQHYADWTRADWHKVRTTTQFILLGPVRLRWSHFVGQLFLL